MSARQSSRPVDSSRRPESSRRGSNVMQFQRVAKMSDKKMKEMFDIFDSDNSGAIETKELGDVMKTLGFGDLSVETLDRLIQEFDVDQSGKMEFDEFKYLLKKYTVERGSPDDVFSAFKLFAGHTSDGRQKSYITLDDLVQVSKDIGEWPHDPVDPESTEQVDACQYARKTLMYRLNQILHLAPEDAGKPSIPFLGLSLPQWREMVARPEDKHHPDAEKDELLDAYGFDKKATYDVYEYEEKTPEAPPAQEETGEQF